MLILPSLTVRFRPRDRTRSASATTQPQAHEDAQHKTTTRGSQPRSLALAIAKQVADDGLREPTSSAAMCTAVLSRSGERYTSSRASARDTGTTHATRRKD